jgi:predicted glycoside hydrolase/deacetylase ChbG (UPF0249 family)
MAGSLTFFITADDFGYGAAINRGIAESFRRGLITHASLIVNAAAAAEASEIAHDLRVADRVGCHLNLAEGAPLTNRIRHLPFFCRDGTFTEPLTRGRFRPLSSDAAGALADEIRAQIAEVRRLGLGGAHLDSHRYVHTMPNVLPIALAVAREMGVRRVRPVINCGPTAAGVRGLAKRTANRWIARRCGECVDYFGSVDDVKAIGNGVRRRASSAAPRALSVEVMTHPALVDGEVLDAGARPLSAALAELETILGAPVVASPVRAALR